MTSGRCGIGRNKTVFPVARQCLIRAQEPAALPRIGAALPRSPRQVVCRGGKACQAPLVVLSMTATWASGGWAGQWEWLPVITATPTPASAAASTSARSPTSPRKRARDGRRGERAGMGSAAGPDDGAEAQNDLLR